jgi:hypothetical protein
MTTSHPCVADGCRDHGVACPGTATCECPPQPATGRTRICGHHTDHTRQLLRELPELWEILGAPPGRGARSGPAGNDDESNVRPSGRTAATEARTAVEAILMVWLTVLRYERDAFTIPTDDVIARTTRADVVRHQGDADVALHAYRDRSIPTQQRHALHQEAARHQAAAQHLRTARETGRDIIETHRELVDRNLTWLLSGIYADQVVHDIAAVHRVATQTIPSSGTAVRILCDCGARVPIPTPRPKMLTCAACGIWGDLDWWSGQRGPAVRAALRDLPDLVFAAHGLVTTYEQLRQWRTRGYLTPAGDEPGRDRTGTARGRQQLFDLDAVVIVARQRLLTGGHGQHVG